MPELKYHGKTLNPEPINTTLDVVRARLSQPTTQVVILEPGDMTRYTLMLTPCALDTVAPYLGAFGIRPNEALDYVHITQLAAYESHGGWVRRDLSVGSYDLEFIPNEWSREFLAWWLTLVFQQEGASPVALQPHGTEQGR